MGFVTFLFPTMGQLTWLDELESTFPAILSFSVEDVTSFSTSDVIGNLVFLVVDLLANDFFKLFWNR
jgi:hypothetical protein